MTEQRLAKADFIASILLLAVSLFLLLASLAMPNQQAHMGIYSAPGFAPLVFALLLAGLSLYLLVRSIIRQGWRIRLRREHLASLAASRYARRFALALGIVILYAFLLGKVHFVVVTTGFVFAMIYAFKGAVWWANLLIAFGTAVSVWAVFYLIFLVPLP